MRHPEPPEDAELDATKPPVLNTSDVLQKVTTTTIATTIEPDGSKPGNSSTTSSDVTVTQRESPIPVNEAGLPPSSSLSEPTTENVPPPPILSPTAACSGYFVDPVSPPVCLFSSSTNVLIS
jgi:hypothetical protein